MALDDASTTPAPARRRRRAVLVAVAALVVIGVLVALLVGLDDDAPAPAAAPPVVATPTPTPEPAPRDPCARQARRGFVPTSISVPGVVRRAEVWGIARDANNVPGVPPVSEKEVFAWDLGGVEPGSRSGHVLLNTHTWPDGSAMGNRLLDGLEVGGRLVLRDDDGRTACYRVTEEVEVEPSSPPEGWSARDGAPQVVIIVCSGVRRGPGDWSHRTLWFAEPAIDKASGQGNQPASS